MSDGKGVRVTVKDLETGETSSADVKDNYIIIAQGSCEITHTNVFPTKGTHVVTIKGCKGEVRA